MASGIKLELKDDDLVMRNNLTKSCFMLFATWILTSVASVVFAQEAKLSDEQTKFFESKIRPVLVRECYSCHSTRSQVKGGLWLDTKDGAQNGGDSGPAVVPGDLDSSLLWSAINHEDYKMPPRKKLSKETIEDFRKWIEMGAPDPRVQNTTKVNSSITQADIEEGRQFWAFQRPSPVEVPTVDNEKWPITDIDRFILSQLDQHELEPSGDAEATTFLRRLSFDLIGLPPTPKQIAWINKNWNKDREAAVAHIVDSLLAKPEFGERWGRHWLDVARYAESTGKELNLTYPQAWRYRDYVIDSFNEDKPYDQFIKEQIAGDLLPVKSDEQWSENLIATGFLAMGPKTLTEQNGQQFQLDLIDEQIDVATRVVLGVSVACARCHDHKFDPIPQADYYAMAGIFRSTTTHYGTLDTNQNRRASNLLILPVDDLNPFDTKISVEELDRLKSELAEKQIQLNEAKRQRRGLRQGKKIDNPVPATMGVAATSTAVAALETKIAGYDEKGNPYTYFMGVQPADKPVNARLLVRGEFDKPAQEVKRGFPQVLTDSPVEIAKKSSGRLELARWMASGDNPLTARVMVNRVWQHMFGNGIVRTPENFGSTGLPPTHPELLDHLAIKFKQNNWSIKTLIREIATSRIYRTESTFNKNSFEVDPENKLVWRVEPRRLEAEVLRDSILSISGALEPDRPRASLVAEFGAALVRDGFMLSTVGAANPDIESGIMSRNRMRNRGGKSMRGGASKTSQSSRRGVAKIDQPVNYRSVYLPVIRDNVTRGMDVFDFAESSMVVGVREKSNTPDQGLYFLNNQFVIDQSDAIARRIMKEKSNVRDQVKYAFLLAYGRDATSRELNAAESFYREFEVRPSRLNRNPKAQKLSALCQAILASAEFRFAN